MQDVAMVYYISRCSLNGLTLLFQRFYGLEVAKRLLPLFNCLLNRCSCYYFQVLSSQCNSWTEKCLGFCITSQMGCRQAQQRIVIKYFWECRISFNGFSSHSTDNSQNTLQVFLRVISLCRILLRLQQLESIFFLL